VGKGKEEQLAYNVAVDVGGTFTDVLVFDEQRGELTEGKVLSTPDDPSKGEQGVTQCT
jgi:N-methylhydantoinase A